MKVQEALKAVIDWLEDKNKLTEVEVKDLCKSALSDIEKCEPVGEVQGVAVNWYHGTPAESLQALFEVIE